MGENSKIEWTDHTFNPWEGCTKVSDGCKHCYAEALTKRFGRTQWGPTAQRRRTSASNWQEPLKWDRKAEREGVRRRVFCASLADVFEDNPQLTEWRRDLFDLIASTPNLDWLLLTKRPQNIRTFVPVGWVNHVNGAWPQNVWVGTSCENQAAARERIPYLVQVPATVLFLSCEPLLGPLDLDDLISYAFSGDDWHSKYRLVDWVIVGGESGPHARPIEADWVRSLRDQCFQAAIPFFFKQWGGRSKAAAGRELDGRTWEQVPISILARA